MHKGEEVLGIRLNWNKRYITLAPRATVLGLAFKMYDPGPAAGDKGEIGITCALIPTSHPGVRVGDRHYPMGLAFLNGPTFGKDVFIPLDWIIGGLNTPAAAGACLSNALRRSRYLAAGPGHRLRSHGEPHSRRLLPMRKQFGMSIGKFEGCRGAGPHRWPHLSAGRARRMTAGALDLGQAPAIVTAISSTT